MDTILQGLVLLVAGMGIVFLFLMLMVFIMGHSSKLVARFNHILPDDEPKKKPRVAAPVAVTADNTAVAIAVAVATAQAR